MAMTHLIGLDWGTTSLRAYRFDGSGEVAASRHLPSGIMQIAGEGTAGFERALDQACGDWRSADPAGALVACGMVGSAQGWREAPYAEIPASVDALGRALTTVDTAHGVLHIIPGLIARGPLPDVMRGEETQVVGLLERLEAPEVWIGLPGTHAKWVRVRDRRIVAFHTFMTGEVFAALRAHTILGRTMRPAPAPDLAAFDRGVAVARSPDGRRGVLSTVFSTRTLGLVGARPGEAQADYLSGLLSGAEIAALGALGEPTLPIALAGDAELCARYGRALAASGRAATIAEGATERGLWRIAVAAGLAG
ncbi:MAG TPA: 2-dehydro-3-deoxygalactonokinase [Kofleriaceae bacterium]|nr:2-dehydro-3-deoxygalactonokinase [Kofleriaceae bacterium]